MMIKIKKEQVVEMLDTPFVKVYDLQYERNHHYYDVTRRSKDELLAIQSDEEMKQMHPDAVSCVVILQRPNLEPLLCVMKEYRYPIGRVCLICSLRPCRKKGCK